MPCSEKRIKDLNTGELIFDYLHRFLGGQHASGLTARSGNSDPTGGGGGEGFAFNVYVNYLV